MTILLTLFAIFVHGIASHMPACKKINSIKLFLLISCILGLGYIIVQYATYGGSFNLVANCLLYGFSCELYIFIFTMCISSVSANILLRLLAHNLKLDDIKGFYDSKHMVNNRLERLCKIGFIEGTPQELCLSNKGHLLVNVFTRLRLFFRHRN